jgi:hypothetical protein
LDQELSRIAAALERLATVAEVFALGDVTPPPMPGVVSVRYTGEFFYRLNDEGARMNLIRFVIVLPNEDTLDVVNRKVTVGFADGTSAETIMEGRLAGETVEFKGAQDSTITVRVVSYDDATPPNVSVPRVQTFTLADIFAPPEPGEVGLRATGEEPVPDA